MLTRQEFFTTRSVLLQSLERGTLAALVVGAVCVFPAIHFFLRGGAGVSWPIRLVGLTLPLLIGLGFPVFLRYRTATRARALHLVCPRCGASLLWDSLRGNACSRCREIVFEQSASSLPTPLEFYDRVSAFDDASARSWNIAFAVWGGVLGGGLLIQLVYWLYRIPEPGWAGWVALILLIIAVPGPLLYGGIRTERLVSALGLRCPNCNDSLVGGDSDQITQLTLRTRRCPACGAQVVAESNEPIEGRLTSA